MTDRGNGPAESRARLHVLSAGAAKGLVQALQPRFTERTGADVAATFGAVGAIREQWAAGAPCDVIILTAAMLDEMAAAGHIAADSRRPLGRVFTGVAVRAQAPRPAIDTREALRTSLAAASALYCPDTSRSTAGIHFLRVLEHLGLREAARPRLREYPNGATAMAQLAAEGPPAAIGCTQVTEILYTPGVELVGKLPREFELATVYAAAVCARAGDRTGAHRLIELLSGAESDALRGASGFEPV
jgi:molybdate transport system substrate-binding protein